MSQIFDLGSSSYFMSRRVTFLHFLKLKGTNRQHIVVECAKLLIFKTEKNYRNTTI